MNHSFKDWFIALNNFHHFTVIFDSFIYLGEVLFYGDISGGFLVEDGDGGRFRDADAAVGVCQRHLEGGRHRHAGFRRDLSRK